MQKMFSVIYIKLKNENIRMHIESVLDQIVKTKRNRWQNINEQ